MIDFYAWRRHAARERAGLHIKGANWFGTEEQHAVLYGLEKRSLDDLLAFLAANGFNALRLLFNHEHVDSDPPTPAYDLAAATSSVAQPGAVGRRARTR